MIPGLHIRIATPADSQAIAALNAGIVETAPWRPEDYTRPEAVGMEVWVAEVDGVLSGFIAFRCIAGEMEVLNLGVMEKRRRRGAGGSLLREALAVAAQRGAERAFLEVRASNRIAQQFYARHGFQVTGRRRRYYQDPSEDALLMTRVLAGEYEFPLGA